METAAEPVRVAFGAFELDEADARLTCAGVPVALPPKPFAVLCALVRAPRTLVTKDALLDSVWGHRHVTESVLKTAISELRAALEDDPKHPLYIETVSRRGYRFVASISAPALQRDAAAIGPATPAAAAIVGRKDALERLHVAWRRAQTGALQVLWIAGEAGVGKTTLVERFIAEVGEANVAHGQCVAQFGAGEPYLPILEALTTLCRRDARFGDLMKAVAPTWWLQLPWLSSVSEREALLRELAGSGPARMPREMGELLEGSTGRPPLLLVTEDLHWSDPATLQLLDYIARRRGGARLMWLATFRLTQIVARDHPFEALRHELRLHGLAEEIVLDAFSEAEVAEYLATRAPGLEADEGFVRELHQRTEGLPLFVAAIANDVGDASTRSAPGSMPVPEGLSGIVEGYIAELAADEHALLEAAGVCGVHFQLATVARMLESDAASLDRKCAELVRRRRWLLPAGSQERGAAGEAGYAFRHALYREVLHARIAPMARVQLHRKAAEALESERGQGRPIGAAELASHFENGREPMAALRYYAEAADSALRHFSPSQAMHLAGHALQLLPQAGSTLERTRLEATLAILQGTACLELFGLGAAEGKLAFLRALPLLDHVPDHPLRGLLLNALGLMLYTRGEVEEAQSLARRSEALAASGDGTAMLCACLVQGLIEHLRGRPRLALEWLEKGIAAPADHQQWASSAVAVADPLVVTLGFAALARLHLGRVEEGRACLREARERAAALRAPGPRAAALWLEALFEVRIGDAARVAAISDELLALSAEYELPQARSAHLWFAGWAQAHLGDPRAGHRRIREGWEQARLAGMRAMGSEVLGYAAEALVLAGDWAAAREELREAKRCAEDIGERHYLVQLLLLEARVAQALGERSRAQQATAQAIDEARAQQAPWLERIAAAAPTM